MLKNLTVFAVYSTFLVSFYLDYVTSVLKTSVAVVTMIKNEPELLSLWLQYHSELFGLQNIAVLDNHSHDHKTHAILKEWESKGLHVFYNKGPYAEKGNLILETFKSVFPYHHIALPLDVDEFIVSYQDGIPVVKKQLIQQYIDEFWMSDYPCYSFRQYDFISMHTEGSTINTLDEWCSSVYSPEYAKKMTRKNLLEHLDHGNHHAYMKYNISESKCFNELNRVGLLHYYAIDPGVMARKALADCIGFGHLPPNTTLATAHQHLEELKHLRNQHGVLGSHKVARLIAVLENGLNVLLEKCPTRISKLGTLPQIVERLKLET